MALTRDQRKELKFKAMSPFALCFDNYAIDPSILSKRQATRIIAAAERKDLQCLDEDADAIITAMLGSMLTPKSRPRLYVRPPLCRSHNAKGHLAQMTTLTHNCGPVTGTKCITAKAYRVSDQLTVR